MVGKEKFTNFFCCSSIIIAPVSEWCCTELYCPFLHLVTPTTSWYQWHHPLLWGGSKRDRNRTEMDFLRTWRWPEVGIPSSILHVPVWSSCPYCWTWTLQWPFSTEDTWNMWDKVNMIAFSINLLCLLHYNCMVHQNRNIGVVMKLFYCYCSIFSFVCTCFRSILVWLCKALSVSLVSVCKSFLYPDVVTEPTF